MEFKFLLLVGLLCLLVVQARPADEEYAEYEDEPAPPPKPVARPNPLKGRRNPLAGRAANNKPTSTTTAEPVQDEEVVDEDEPVEEPVEPTSTTESPKKIKPGVRPFRSNDDLLAALKRRREQAAANHKAQPKPAQTDEESGSAEAAPSPAKSRASTGRKRFNAPKSAEPAQSSEEGATPAPARSGRRFSSRN